MLNTNGTLHFICLLFKLLFHIKYFFFHQTRLFKDLMHLTNSKYNIIIYAFGAIEIRMYILYIFTIKNR